MAWAELPWRCCWTLNAMCTLVQPGAGLHFSLQGLVALIFNGKTAAVGTRQDRAIRGRIDARVFGIGLVCRLRPYPVRPGRFAERHHYVDPIPVSLSDVISWHVPLMPETLHIDPP